MFIKVTRSQAITALLAGKLVFCGDAREGWGGAHGLQLGRPDLHSRRAGAKALTRFFYGDSMYPRHAHVGYWVYEN